MTDFDVELQRIARRDTGAFTRWLAGVEQEVRLSLRPFAAYVDTEAVLQEAFMRVWQVAPRFVPDGRPHSLLRLAVVTAKNLARSEARRGKASTDELEHIESSLAEQRQMTAASFPEPLLRERIKICHQKLPEKPRQALAARLASAGSDRDEVLAEVLQMRLNTFLQNFTRARKLLLECLRKAGVDVTKELADAS